ncbi:MAG TPA: M14 family zinc carboxypeptidase, partial [Gemmatimonadaceae bacterium]|nr:M14 family zinc carboxypeptidase [Gemmatimonadaceae bacterium]
MRMRIIAGLLVALATPASGQIDFTSFKDPAGVSAALTNMQTRFPALAQVITIGTSVEGRPIQALKISDNVATSEPSEGAIILIATQHAREWLAGETALFVAEKILERYATDAVVHADVDRLEIFIVPVVNVDGFAYTWSAPANRYWRKNRRVNPGGTFGVDLNRNWGFQWAAIPAPGDAGGSYGTATETSDVYYGTGPFSEPEIQAVRDLANSLPNLKAFEDIHTYSELYLAPWRYTSAVPNGGPSLEALANRQVTVTSAVHGHTYTRNLYRSSGGAIDFIWNGRRAGAISPELRPSAAAPDGGFAP